MALDDFQACLEEDGWFAEIIDGVVHMSPSPKPYHHFWRSLLSRHLFDHGRLNPGLADFVNGENDVVVPTERRRGPTRPRPDITVYQRLAASDMLARDADWATLPAPVVVVEVLSPSTRQSDLFLKSNVYWEQGAIQEYWIVDAVKHPGEPTLIIHVRRPGADTWTKQEIPYGESYRCGCIAGLEVNLRSLRSAFENRSGTGAG